LFHELAHLLFRTSGIDVADESYIDRLEDKPKRVEIVCNQFAAAFLIPEDAFDELLAGRASTRETAAFLAEQFKVSREVIYRKLLNRGLIAEEEYRQAAASWAKQVTTGEGGGGNYYYNQITYLGRRYIDLALTRYNQRRIDSSQLAAYLNIKPRNVDAFEYAYAGLR
jgi:Zn-dependent peptidase ImmA (M78 family)